MIWLWMGDPALADPALVPDMHWNDDPAWAGDGTSQSVLHRDPRIVLRQRFDENPCRRILYEAQRVPSPAAEMAAGVIQCPRCGLLLLPGSSPSPAPGAEAGDQAGTGHATGDVRPLPNAGSGLPLRRFRPHRAVTAPP